MKKLLLGLILLAGAPGAQAQDSEQLLVGKRTWRVPRLPVENGQISYQAGVVLQGVTREALYNKAYYWLKHNLKTDDVAMRVADKRTGHIAGRGKISYGQNVVASHAKQGIYFDYDIHITDEGYTYRLDNFQGLLSGNPIDYSAMYREELNLGDTEGQWSHKYRFEMISDLHAFTTLFLQGLRAEMVR